MSRRPAVVVRGWVGAGCSTSTFTLGTPAIAATVVLMSSTMRATTSGLADWIVSDTVTPEYPTSISLTMPNDTISRVKPGYLTFFSSVRISLGFGIGVRRHARRNFNSRSMVGAYQMSCLCYHLAGSGKTDRRGEAED